MKVLWIDTETTGLDSSKCGLTEIAGIVEIDGKVIDRFDLRGNPLMHYPRASVEALEKTGKTVREIHNYPRYEEMYNSLLAILDKHVDRYNREDKFWIAGYNVDFDVDFLEKFFKINGNEYMFSYFHRRCIDLYKSLPTLIYQGFAYDHELVWRIMHLENMKLGTVAKHFGFDIDQAHSAAWDINITREIYWKILFNSTKAGHDEYGLNRLKVIGNIHENDGELTEEEE
jgi:DNA polymerase-3 subunit epsilon